MSWSNIIFHYDKPKSRDEYLFGEIGFVLRNSC